MTHKERVLQLLKDGKPHSHHELYGLGCVAHSRISDLRRDGHKIDQWRDGDLYLYRLALNEVSESSSPLRLEASLSASASSPAPPLEAAVSTAQSGRDGVGVLTLFPVTGPARPW